MKLGLVLEGGASRTYFSAGVIDVLLEENIIADYVIGVSAGISNACCSYCSGQIGRTIEIGEKYVHDKRYMGSKFILKKDNNSYFNLKFVFDDIPNKLVPFDYEAFKKFKGNCIAGVTNIETGEAEFIEVPKDDKEFKLLRATCALPLLFKPIEINGKKYLDGGIAVAVPIEKAIEDGCDKNIVILTREKGYRKKKEKALNIAVHQYKKFPKFVDKLLARTENYNAGREVLEKLEKEGKIFVFAPSKTEGFKRTESDPEKIMQIYKEGYNLCKDKMEELRAYLNS